LKQETTPRGSDNGDISTNNLIQLSDSNNNDDILLFSFDLQEINHVVQNSSSTGSMSWDASIVMGLYFALYPVELCGNTLHILSSNAAAATTLAITSDDDGSGDDDDERNKERRAVTLTDVSDDVLNMLQQNIKAAAKPSTTGDDDRILKNTDVSIQKLDWFGFSNDSENNQNNASSNNNGNNNISSNNTSSTYNTIIASDCATFTRKSNHFPTRSQTFYEKTKPKGVSIRESCTCLHRTIEVLCTS